MQQVERSARKSAGSLRYVGLQHRFTALAERARLAYQCAMATTAPPDTDRLLETLRGTLLGLVRRGDRDLTARQLAVFLTCYHESESQTVRGLAEKLELARSAICRALDRLGGEALLRRKPDPLDRRSVVAMRTAEGNAFLRDLRQIMAEAAKAAENFTAPADLTK